MFGRKKDTKEVFEKGREEFSQDQIVEVIEKEKGLKQRFEDNESLNSYFSDFKIFISLLKDYYSGAYRQIPWRTVAAIGATLLYVLSPFDLIVDIIPIIGFTDDAAVFAFCLKMVSDDIQKYREWKRVNESS